MLLATVSNTVLFFFCFLMQFDALVSALPLSSEEDQLKRIKELQVYVSVLPSEKYIVKGWH